LLPASFVAAAFGLRVFLGYVFSYYGGDAPGYTAIARNLAAAHGYSIATNAPYLATDIRLPGYPFFLAIAFSINGSHWSVILLNSLLGAVSTLFVWLIAQGLQLTRPRALWTTGIAALFISTASITGIAQSENLSIPAVLAFVFFVLIRPPRSRVGLFVGGSALAWLVALTRDELVVFVVFVAVVAAHRAKLRALGSIALVLCFLIGSGAWVLRNEVQVHRTEYVDSVMTDQVLVASVNGNLALPLYNRAGYLITQPTISPAARSDYQRQVDAYVKQTLFHHPATFVENKVKYFIESLFPVPIYGLTYVSAVNVLGWMAWSVILAAGYLLSLSTAVRWWKRGRGKDVVSILLFPIFILCFQVVFDPQYRFWYPAVLLLLPLAVEGANRATLDRLVRGPARDPARETGAERAKNPARSVTASRLPNEATNVWNERL
jgi:hypothetical protein